MTRFGPALILLFLLLTVRPAFAQDQKVLIRVIQKEASMLHDFQTNLMLERRPFKFEVMFKNVEGIFVFASMKDSVYRFTENSDIRDFSYLKLLELRNDDIYNTNRELNISEEGWTYWFYKPEPDKHSFSHKVIPIDTDRVVVTKYIKQLYNVADGKVIKLRDVEDPVYIFIVAVAEYDSDGKPVKELLRRKIRIGWVNED